MGGVLSPLLSNILLDELDKELEQRGHHFVRYADDFQVYVKSEAAAERVMASLERFLAGRLRLKVNREKSAVGRPWDRKFLGYRMFLGYRTTVDRRPKLQPHPQSVKRLKLKLKALFRRGRGWSLERTIKELNPILRGWGNYYRLTEVDGVFKDLDQWIRRACCCGVSGSGRGRGSRNSGSAAWMKPGRGNAPTAASALGGTPGLST